MTSFGGVGTSAGVGTNSPTLSAWVLSLTGTGLARGMGASARAPYAAVEAEAMASATISAPSKKPSISMAVVAEISPLMG